MKPRRVIARSATPAGEAIELCHEAGQYVIRVGGVPLMASAQSGSERAMAELAAARLGQRARPRVLVGGLGMGFTLRAALDQFGSGARITVAELVPAIVDFNRGELASLAGHPLDDPRTELYAGDVGARLQPGNWDAILVDVDNGPDALTVPDNASLYTAAGLRRLAAALAPGGVAVIWSAYESPAFERRAAAAGVAMSTHRVRSRGDKGARHTLFVVSVQSRGTGT